MIFFIEGQILVTRKEFYCEYKIVEL